MCSSYLHTTVISHKGYILDISLPITKVEDLDAIVDELVTRGYKPWPGDITPPADPDPEEPGDPEEDDTEPLDQVVMDGNPPWPFSDADTEDEADEEINVDSSSVGAHRDAPDSKPIKPRILHENILAIVVEAIPRGTNKGEPMWRIETDVAREVCIFDLDPLVRDRLITREDALDGWQEIGRRFTFPTPIPATFHLQADQRYYTLDKVDPPTEHQEKIRATKPGFVPKNILVISDVVNEDDNKLVGRTGDYDEVPIVTKDLPHFAAVGHDISTFTHAEPYLRQPISVMLKDGVIKYVKAIDGAWTMAKHASQLQRGDLLRLTNEEQPYHPISATRKAMGTARHITFQDDHEAVTLHGTQIVALTQPESVPDGDIAQDRAEPRSEATTATDAGVPADYVAPPLPDALVNETQPAASAGA